MTQSYGQRMKALRCQRGFEQADLGLCLGLHKNKLLRIENGLQPPILSDICALLVALQAKFEDLFSAELALAKADVHARIADHKPPVSTSHRTARRVESFRDLKTSLDAPHGIHC